MVFLVNCFTTVRNIPLEKA